MLIPINECLYNIHVTLSLLLLSLLKHEIDASLSTTANSIMINVINNTILIMTIMTIMIIMILIIIIMMIVMIVMIIIIIIMIIITILL